MARYFLVEVDFLKTAIYEKTETLKRVDWACRVNGERFEYMLVNVSAGIPKRWFERGTVELQYHAKNAANGGFVAWDKRASRVYTPTKKTREIMAKMDKLL